MKKIYLAIITVLSIIPFISKAQWNTSGTNIYNTNAGNVGINTSTPWGKLQISSTLGVIIPGINLDPSTGFSLTPLQNGGNLLIGLNYSGGGAETDFITNRGGGFVGGFRFYDYTNAGVLKPLMTILGNGYVGIGTIFPSTTLDVSGPTTSTPTIINRNMSYNSTNSSGTTALGLYFSDHGAVKIEASKYTTNITDLNFYGEYGFNTPSPIMTLHPTSPTAGNVGIGTNVPISGGAAASWLTINGNTTYSGGVAYAIQGAVKGFSYVDNDGLFTQQAIATGQKFVVNTSTTAMTMLTNGNIGIGTTIPGGLIHLYSSSASDMLRLQFNAGGGGNWAINPFIYTVSNGGLSFVDKLHSTTPMVISDAGKVGIGTTTPDQLLTVKGTIHANEVKVDLNVPGPDYVFAPDYKLTPLAEVKAYVEKNHHLPEVPSANEMAKNGIDLGDMNTRLLKKVEELTLYLIAKDKELTSQQQKIIEQDTRFRLQQQQIDELKSQVAKLIDKQ